MRQKNMKPSILFFVRILVLSIIFLFKPLFVHEAISAQSPAEKKLSFLAINPAKTTIRIGGIATLKLIANYENGSQEIVNTIKYKGEEKGVFPITSEYEGKKTLVLAKVFVIDNKAIEEIYFRPKEITIEIGETVVLNILAKFVDGSEGIISTEEYKGTELGTFPLSSSFETKKATASITVRGERLARVPLKRSDYARCPRLQPCSDCHRSFLTIRDKKGNR